MKARKKSGVIEVQQYHHDQVQTWPPYVAFSAREANAPAVTAVWNEPQQQWQHVSDGDYIRIDLPTDIYPIKQAYFAENFDVVED